MKTKKNWRTTLFGIIAAAAQGIASAAQTDGTTQTIAQTIAMVATGLMGWAAADHSAVEPKKEF